MKKLTDSPEFSKFMAEHKLPDSYRETFQQWFAPLVEQLSLRVGNPVSTKQHPLLLGINGCQGSGKSTLAAVLKTVLEASSDCRIAILSIDDFYLTIAERERLASTVHPLLRTRGVPGTHDIELLQKILDALMTGPYPVAIPRFDKATDDRKPTQEWDLESKPVDMIILEGWCIGSSAQRQSDLITPVNLLEEQEDPNALWRRYVNEQLQNAYQTVFARIHYWVMLQAPSFDCVFQWRLEQEEKLRLASVDTGNNSGVMSRAQIARFIQHYQRITQHTLATLPEKVDCLFTLDAARHITASRFMPDAST